MGSDVGVGPWLVAVLRRIEFWLIGDAEDGMIDGDVPTPNGGVTRRGYRYREGMERLDQTMQARGARLRELEEAKVKDARRWVEQVRVGGQQIDRLPRREAL